MTAGRGGDRAVHAGSEPSADAVRDALVRWFYAHARVLPWRSEPAPYRVWISEIMLQQTRVETVKDYFERFMARFPTPAALAAAPLDEVLAVWAGLGYYSRARNLHRAAQVIVREHGGALPRALDALLALPGVGRYTAGAIASIAFGLPAPIVDGNVTRVLARLYDLDGDVGSAAVKAELWSRAGVLACGPDPSAINQALMELGATVCAPRSPQCGRCPVATDCLARQRGTAPLRPVKAPRRPPREERLLAVVLYTPDGTPALRRREGEGRFGGLWEPPIVPWPLERAPEPADAAEALLGAGLGAIAAEQIAEHGALEHVLTHRRLVVSVFSASRPDSRLPPGWLPVGPRATGTRGQSRLTARVLALARAGAPRGG